MTISLRSNNVTIVFVGDSITKAGWFDENQSTQGATNLLVQQIYPRVSALSANASPVSISLSSVTAQGAPAIRAINSGVNGNTVANIEADIAGRITNYFPDIVVIEVGINDAAAVPVPTPILDFRASYDNILATVKATLPSVQIVCVGILSDGELWAASPTPHFAGNTYDTEIEIFEAQIAASAAAHGAAYVSVRTPAALSESTLNTPAPGIAAGILTLDGVHPNATGQVLMSTAVRTAFS
jgi:lysophospholipase L1-like esterase